jgi:hypothetical protein
MLEPFDGTGECPEDIKVRRLRGKYSGQRCIGSSSIESGASDARAGQEMCDGLHGVLQ